MELFTQTQMEALSAFVAPDRFSTGQSNRELHIKDISPHRGKLPAGIIWPVTTEEVSTILAYTYAEGIPVTPWGAGTSTEGNPANPVIAANTTSTSGNSAKAHMASAPAATVVALPASRSRVCTRSAAPASCSAAASASWKA